MQKGHTRIHNMTLMQYYREQYEITMRRNHQAAECVCVCAMCSAIDMLDMLDMLVCVCAHHGIMVRPHSTPSAA